MSSRRRARRIGCATTALALGGPRIALALLCTFGSAVQTAFQSVIFPVVGLIFLPLTTLTYALAGDPTGRVAGAAFVWPAAGFFADAVLLGLGVYWGVEHRLE